jgi:hypothetical protein
MRAWLKQNWDALAVLIVMAAAGGYAGAALWALTVWVWGG